MKKTVIIGILAIIIGISSFIPVLKTVYKTQETNNFPYNSLFLALTANVLWIIYGLYNATYANILSGFLYFIIYSYILYIKWANHIVEIKNQKIKKNKKI